LIKTALLKTGGNQRRAASLLGIKVTTLHNKIKTYGIDFVKIPA
jgi:DNA-binding protein Fis